MDGHLILPLEYCESALADNSLELETWKLLLVFLRLSVANPPKEIDVTALLLVAAHHFQDLTMYWKLGGFLMQFLLAQDNAAGRFDHIFKVSFYPSQLSFALSSLLVFDQGPGSKQGVQRRIV